jgi:hypothetical protein
MSQRAREMVTTSTQQTKAAAQLATELADLGASISRVRHVTAEQSESVAAIAAALSDARSETPGVRRTEPA